MASPVCTEFDCVTGSAPIKPERPDTDPDAQNWIAHKVSDSSRYGTESMRDHDRRAYALGLLCVRGKHNLT